MILYKIYELMCHCLVGARDGLIITGDCPHGGIPPGSRVIGTPTDDSVRATPAPKIRKSARKAELLRRGRRG